MKTAAFVSYEKVDLSSLLRLRDFIEQNYNSELHDIWDQLNDELTSFQDSEDEIRELKLEIYELEDEKQKVNKLIKNKGKYDYDKFVSKLERIVF